MADLDGRLGREKFSHRNRLWGALARIKAAERVETKRAGGGQLCRGSCERSLDRLKASQRPTECGPFLDVGNSNRQGTIGNANCLDPDEGARSLDATIKLMDSLTGIAQKIFTRYMHVVEINFGEGDGVETHRWQL